MIKYILIIILFLNNHLSFAQTKLEVISVMQSNCDHSADISRIQHRIVNEIYKKDTFEICIGVVANCAGIYDIQAEYANDTINFSYREGSIERDTVKKRGKTEIIERTMMLACDCCFEFRFTVLKVPDKPKFVTVNNIELKYYADKYKKYPVKFDLINSDTINFSDEYGFKQGKWNKIHNERHYEDIDSLTKYEFDAIYVDNRIKTAQFIQYDSLGKLRLKESITDFDKSRTVRYYENGVIQSETVNNGYRLGSISYSFFKNGALEQVKISTYEFKDEQVYYENGKLKKIHNRYIYQEYYPNEVLKYERINDKKNPNIWSKYYYDNGKIMSIYYIKQFKKNTGQTKSWREFYDINGNRVSEEYLIQQGFKSILDL